VQMPHRITVKMSDPNKPPAWAGGLFY